MLPFVFMKDERRYVFSLLSFLMTLLTYTLDKLYTSGNTFVVTLMSDPIVVVLLIIPLMVFYVGYITSFVTFTMLHFLLLGRIFPNLSLEDLQLPIDMYGLVVTWMLFGMVFWTLDQHVFGKKR